MPEYEIVGIGPIHYPFYAQAEGSDSAYAVTYHRCPHCGHEYEKWCSWPEGFHCACGAKWIKNYAMIPAPHSGGDGKPVLVVMLKAPLN